MVHGGYVYAGMTLGAYRQPIPGTTSVELVEDLVPVRASLFQNYPNPFNAETTIRFEIAERAFVALRVYDLLGREIASLVNETLSPGSYVHRWNPSGLPSGVYFMNLRAGVFHGTRRLILLR
jgi:hypothetical protein